MKTNVYVFKTILFNFLSQASLRCHLEFIIKILEANYLQGTIKVSALRQQNSQRVRSLISLFDCKIQNREACYLKQQIKDNTE